MRTAGTAILLCMALALVGCGSDDGATTNPGGEAGQSSEASAEAPERSKPKVEAPKGPAPKELVKNDLIEGSGAAAKAGDEVSVHYVLVDHKTGKEVEASWDRGEPFGFELGSGAVIAGWEEGVVGMKAGGRRELVVPSDLAYGSGALVFVIDLLEIGDAGEEPEPDSDAEADADSTADYEERPKPKVKVPSGPPPTEVVVNDLEEGSGPGAKDGDEIVVNYVGVNYKTGKEFESTFSSNEPATFPVGGEVLIDGWEEGIQGMKAGGRRELRIPSKLAFDRGPVVYVIDLLEIK